MSAFRTAGFIVLLLLAIGGADAQLIVEDFDSYTTGSPPPWMWWDNGSSGSIQVDETTYRGSSGKSVELARTAFDGKRFGFGRNFPPIEGSGELSFYFRAGSTTDEILTAVGGNTPTARWPGGSASAARLATPSEPTRSPEVGTTSWMWWRTSGTE